MSSMDGYSQIRSRKPVNQPYADQKLYHFGFLLGITTQDMIISHTGYVSPTNQSWFAEIPSYSVGFSVGIIGDRYINEYLNLRLSPTISFGEKKFVFKEQTSLEEYTYNQKSSNITLPLHLKFSANRRQNIRPYVLAGGYASVDISSKKNDPLRMKKTDYGLEFGVGCNIYLPLFKLCPELKFSLGLADVINKDNSDVIDEELLKYRHAISSGKTRTISLIFNFE